MKRIICFICILLLSSMGSIETYADTVSGDDGKEEEIRVLIVGNSFSRNGSYSVEKPLMELAAGEGHNLEVVTLAYGSARLVYYAGMDDAYLTYYREFVELLVTGKWDYIIFQEQTTSPIEHFEDLTVPAVERLQQMVKIFQPQATMLLYMNAGFSDGKPVQVNGTGKLLTTDQMALYLGAGFAELENRFGIEAVMVGMHSYRINILYPEINMVRDDARHPNYTGYYLAACCFYNRIYGTIPDPLKASLTNCVVTDEQLVAITALPADSIEPDKKNIVLDQGDEEQLNAVVSSHLPQYSNISYRSLNEDVATVNAKTGVVKAKNGGNTVIVAESLDGLQAFCSVKVNQPLSFVKDYYIAGKGDTIKIEPQTNHKNLKWSSGNKAVATVDASTGVVSAKQPGKSTIKVKNKDDDRDVASYILYVTCDTPKNIKTASYGNPAEGAKYGNIKVSWKAVKEASGYEVYRSTTKNGTYQPIGTSAKASYIDKTAAVNKYYYYKVVAKNSYRYCTSSLSDSAEGIILKAPVLKVKRTKAGIAKLTWEANTKAMGYVIYGSEKKNSGYEEIARVTSNSKTSFKDKSVKNQKRYYRIKAYRTLDNKVFYGVKSVKAEL